MKSINLTGNLKKDILQHILKMNSSRFLELTEELIRERGDIGNYFFYRVVCLEKVTLP
jgi:hypothetical protein